MKNDVIREKCWLKILHLKKQTSKTCLKQDPQKSSLKKARRLAFFSNKFKYTIRFTILKYFLFKHMN